MLGTDYLIYISLYIYIFVGVGGGVCVKGNFFLLKYIFINMRENNYRSSNIHLLSTKVCFLSIRSTEYLIWNW